MRIIGMWNLNMIWYGVMNGAHSAEEVRFRVHLWSTDIVPEQGRRSRRRLPIDSTSNISVVRGNACALLRWSVSLIMLWLRFELSK